MLKKNSPCHFTLPDRFRVRPFRSEGDEWLLGSAGRE